MADGALFTEDFKRRHADVMGSIESGPTSLELIAGRARTGGLGLAGGSGMGLASTEPEQYIPGQDRTDSLKVMKKVQAIRESRALVEQAKQEAQRIRLENASRALAFTGNIAQAIGGLTNEEQRQQLREQSAGMVPQGLEPLLDLQIENQVAANLERKEALAKYLEYSPTMARQVALGADPIELLSEADTATPIMEEFNRGAATAFMKPARSKMSWVMREFESRFPERFKQMKKTDEAISVSEGKEMVGVLMPEDADLNDKSFRDSLFNVMDQNPEALRLKPDPEVAARREEELKESTKAKYRERGEPKALSVTNYITPDGRELLGKTTHEGVFLQDENGAFTVRAPQGTKEVGIQVTGGPEEFLPNPAAAFQGALDTAGNIADYTDLLRMLDEGGPGIVGYRGFLTTEFMGPLAQLNRGLAEFGAEKLSGKEGLRRTQAFRTRAQAIVGRAVGELEIEETGRITEAEREIARRAVALTRVGMSFEQVRSGLVSLMQLAVVNQEKKLIEAGGKPDSLDTEDQQFAFLRRMTGMGMTSAQAEQTLTSTISMRQQIARVLAQVKGEQ